MEYKLEPILNDKLVKYILLKNFQLMLNMNVSYLGITQTKMNVCNYFLFYIILCKTLGITRMHTFYKCVFVLLIIT